MRKDVVKYLIKLRMLNVVRGLSDTWFKRVIGHSLLLEELGSILEDSNDAEIEINYTNYQAYKITVNYVSLVLLDRYSRYNAISIAKEIASILIKSGYQRDNIRIKITPKALISRIDHDIAIEQDEREHSQALADELDLF